MSDILTFVKEELELQKSLLRRSQKILAHAPEGTLRYRPRKKGDAFYQARFSSGIVKEMNITENKAAIDDLIQKRISRETIPAAQKNIKILEQLLASYQLNSFIDIIKTLPDGSIKLWEHLGLLKKLDYCEHNAYKLNRYQLNGFLIGRNLIITQDDNKGDCSSSFIDKMIHEHLLPYYK